MSSSIIITPHLIAVIGDLDSVTGFLLAGIGSANYLIVEHGVPLDSAVQSSIDRLVAREDIAVVFVVHFLEQQLRERLKDRQSAFPIVVPIPVLF